MSFAADITRIRGKIAKRNRAMFVNSAIELQRSVVEGSEITGAPGQPVDTGLLKGSYTPDFTGPWSWRTATNVEYAPHVEHNARGVTFKNGGAHSVALTVAGWKRIVQNVRDRVVGS